MLGSLLPQTCWIAPGYVVVQKNDFQIGEVGGAAQPAHHLESVHGRHKQIGNNQIWAGLVYQFQRRLAVVRFNSLVAAVAEQGRNQIAVRRPTRSRQEAAS